MTIRPAAGSDAERPRAALAVLEPQGERRRRQLVEIAARVIEQEGVDAVRIPHVAELAGVGRTAIYRYFPRREDLLEAVSVDFDERLQVRVGAVDFAEGLLALHDGSSDEMSPSTRRLFDGIWDVLDECGPAGLILRSHSAVHEGEGQEPYIADRFRAQWIEVGLPEIEATLIGDTANAILTRLYFSARRGEIRREEAIRMGHRALVALISGLSGSRRP